MMLVENGLYTVSKFKSFYVDTNFKKNISQRSVKSVEFDTMKC